MKEAARDSPTDSLIPLTLQYERSPVMRGSPFAGFPHLDLRRTQSRCWSHVLLKHSCVKVTHQLRRRGIVYAPETGYYARRSRIHKTAGQANQSFSSGGFAECRLASTQDH